MAEPYVGEIRIMANTYAPPGWAACDGSQIAISDNPTLYQVLGTTYGGDGQNNFNLPDLRGRLPVHLGAGLPQGQSSGAERVTLQTANLPPHNHLVVATQAQAGQSSPFDTLLAVSTGPLLYGTISGQPGTPMSSQSIGFTGSDRPHDNMMPFLTLNFMIALEGLYPTTN